MPQFGYRHFITVLLPGSMVTAAAWLLVDRFAPGSRVHGILASVFREEWQFALVAVLASALLGTMIAALFSYIEIFRLDRARVKEFQKKEATYTKADYEREWNAYVDSLDKSDNTYVTSIVEMFYFESRSSVGALVLGVAWALWSTSTSEFVLSAIVVLLGLFLYWTADHSHKLLAGHRRRRFKS